MAEENRHIERIRDTQANIRANLDAGQSAILTDVNQEWVYENDPGDRLYYMANQYYWDGAGIVYCDAEFEDVTAHGNLYTSGYVYHYGDTDTRIHFDLDTMSLMAGGLEFIYIVEDGTQDTLEINRANQDIDTIINTTIADTLFIRGSDGVVAIGSNAPQAWKTATYPDVLSFGNDSAIACDGTDTIHIVAGQFWDIVSDRWEYSGNYVSTRITINDGMALHVDASGGGAAGAQVAAMELYHAKATGVNAGEFVINDESKDVNTRVETNGLEYAFFIDGGTDRVAIGHATPDVLFHIEQDTATTNAVQRIFRIAETCSDTVADGFGVGMQFEIENATQAANYIAGAIDVIWEDETDGDSDMIFSVDDGWTLAEKFRVSSLGDGTLVGSVIAESLIMKGRTTVGAGGATGSPTSCTIGNNGMLEVTPTEASQYYTLTAGTDGQVLIVTNASAYATTIRCASTDFLLQPSFSTTMIYLTALSGWGACELY